MHSLPSTNRLAFFFLFLAALVVAPLRMSAMEIRRDGDEDGKDASGGNHTRRDSKTEEYEADKRAAARVAWKGSIDRDDDSEQDDTSAGADLSTPRVTVMQIKSRSQRDHYLHRQLPDLEKLPKKSKEAWMAAQQLGDILECIQREEPTLSVLTEQRKEAWHVRNYWDQEYKRYNDFLEKEFNNNYLSENQKERIDTFLSAAYAASQAGDDFLKETDAYNRSWETLYEKKELVPFSNPQNLQRVASSSVQKEKLVPLLPKLPQNSQNRTIAWGTPRTESSKNMYPIDAADSKEEEESDLKDSSRVRGVVLKKAPAGITGAEKKYSVAEVPLAFSSRPPSRDGSIAYAKSEGQKIPSTESGKLRDRSDTDELTDRVISPVKIHPSKKIVVTAPPRPFFSFKRSSVLDARPSINAAEGAAWKSKMNSNKWKNRFRWLLSSKAKESLEKFKALPPDEDEN